MKTLEQKMHEHKRMKKVQQEAHEAWIKYLGSQSYEDFKKWQVADMKLWDAIWDKYDCID